MSGEGTTAVIVGGVLVAALYVVAFRATDDRKRARRRRGDGDDSDDRRGVLDAGPRWDAGLTVALLCGGAGVLLGNTALFLSSTVGFAYATYRYGARPPGLDVAVERTIDDRSPAPSREIEVTFTATNEGERSLADLRIVDGVPERLGVVSGSPRHCTSLRPGESATFSYVLRARRGSHEFGATTLVARNISGSVSRREERRVEATVTCETRAEDVSLPARTSSYPGHITTDSGGEGVEFYATREYQAGDPLSRVDWKRYARTRELTTVDFRQTRAATVVVVVDVRAPSHVARRDGEPDAVELGQYAAERLAAALLRRNNRVGLSVFGPPEKYLEPAGGDEQAARVRAALEENRSASEQRPVGLFSNHRRNRATESRFDTLRKRLPGAAQVVFVSPVLDEMAVDIAKRFEAYGHPVTVVGPDVTETDTPGGTVEGLERDDRIASVRSGGIRVIDWSPDDPIQSAVDAAAARWSG